MNAIILFMLMGENGIPSKKEIEMAELILTLSIILVVCIIELIIGSTLYLAFIESYKNGNLS